MKKVEAIIRSDKLEDLKNALTGSGLAKGMTVSQVLGYGNQRGFAEFVRGQRIVPTLLAKVKVEIVVKDMAVDEVVDAIRSAVAMGEVGDGKIFIVPIDDVIRIRTGELRGVSMIEGVTDWRKEKRKLSRKLDLRKLKRKRSFSCFFLNFSKSGV